MAKTSFYFHLIVNQFCFPIYMLSNTNTLYSSYHFACINCAINTGLFSQNNQLITFLFSIHFQTKISIHGDAYYFLKDNSAYAKSWFEECCYFNAKNLFHCSYIFIKIALLLFQYYHYNAFMIMKSW